MFKLSPEIATTFVVNPKEETTTFLIESGTVMVKLPFSSDATPIVVFGTTIVTPGRFYFVLLSFTVPLTTFV
jgi:hypothetical protein